MANSAATVYRGVMSDTNPQTAARCVSTTRSVLGEGPVWSVTKQALYWVDIKGLRIHRLDPLTGDAINWPTPFRIGSIAPRRDGGFIGASEHGFVAIDATFSRFDIIADPEASRPGNRFNDGKVDMGGRFWAGTMDDTEEQATGALYRLDADLRWSLQDDGYRVPNGPAFSPDGRFAYHTDSAERVIYRFEIGDDGNLAAKHEWAHFEQADGHPDGMTVDGEGCLWVAFWDGWCVRQLSTLGETIAMIPLPIQRPTSCAFGGAALDRLFITSATVGLDEAALAAQPLAGGLFVIETGITGCAPPPFAG
ncbi:MAG: putative gluconolactonase [Sphingomonadales bacterium]|nr:putative gluconolactonase [Sphingomonadales bacterium]